MILLVAIVFSTSSTIAMQPPTIGTVPQTPVAEQARVQQPANGAIKLPTPNRFMAISRRFQADWGSLDRFHRLRCSKDRYTRLSRFLESWRSGVANVDVKQLSVDEAKVYIKLADVIQQRQLELQADWDVGQKLQKQIPFIKTIARLVIDRRRAQPLVHDEAARQVSEMVPAITAAAERLPDDASLVGRDAKRVLAQLENLQERLRDWQTFYNDYDPLFSWWLETPFQSVDDELATLIKKVAAMPKVDPPATVVKSVAASDEDFPREVLHSLFKNPARLPAIIDEYNRLQWAKREKKNRAPTDVVQTTSSMLDQLSFETLSRSDQVDYVLLRNELKYRLAKAKQAKSGSGGTSLPEGDAGMPAYRVGRAALQIELDHEMIPYSPDELIRIAETEYEWCLAELKKASREMGYGDDWKKAVEKMKTLHVAPGEQPALICKTANESINYLKSTGDITLPVMAEQTWRIEMMTPERQLVNPFFTGGEVISVSFPTSTMTHSDKMQSLRGNNQPFARATVHHELIPGHHLQRFMNDRYQPHRRPFSTPFWLEGWALYWEMQLYDAGFARTPEERMGFLVWRSHRCARIIFSLNFHLGRMSPEQCIDLLVDIVGFERRNATAEVRRSVGRSYPPLYQAAYMLGGLQIRQLYRELVEGEGDREPQMTAKEFHDAILREHSIPITMVRAILTNQKLAPSGITPWRFPHAAFSQPTEPLQPSPSNRSGTR